MDFSVYHLIYLILPAIVLLSAVTDMRHYIVPNSLNLALFVGFYIYAFMNPNFNLEMIGYHSLTGFIALLVTFGFFALGLFGGGDAKLIAAISLWLGGQQTVYFLLFTLLAGGIVALILLLWRRTKPFKIYDHNKILFSLFYGPPEHHDSPMNKRAIPYATAIAVGFFLILPDQQTYIEIISI